MSGTNGTSASAHRNGRAANPFAGRRVKYYQRQMLDNWLFHPALRDGQFRLYDVPAMLQDHAVNIGLWAIYGPLAQATWEVRATSKVVKQFIDNTLHRFWAHDLFRVLQHYVPWGTAVCEVMYELDNQSGLWKYAGMDDFDIRDVTAMIGVRSRHLTRIIVSQAGLAIPGMTLAPEEWRGVQPNVVEHPKIFWLGHRTKAGELFGHSTLEAAWSSWMERVGAHGAVSVRKLFAFSNAFRGCWVRYPPGVTTKQDGTVVDNQDIAREIAESMNTGAVGAIPGGYDEQGKPLWEIIDPKLNGDISGLLEYPTTIQRETWQGMGVPDEIISSPDVGGLWGGNGGKLSAAEFLFLSIEDQRVREIMTAFDVGPAGYTTRNQHAGGVIRSLVVENFGRNERYSIHPISLIPKPKEPGAGGSQQSAPGAAATGAPGGAPAAPTPGGMPPEPKAMPQPAAPVKMSTVELTDADVQVALSGLFDEQLHPRKGAGEGGGQFTHKPISAEHVRKAQKQFKAGKLTVSHSPEPVPSDASGEPIHHHVTLESGQRVHPDELHRLRVEDGETVLDSDEDLAIHEPGGRSSAKTFGEALHKIGAFAHKPDEGVTVVSKHGYSDEGHEHTGRHIEHDGSAKPASAEETDAFLAPQTGGQGRLAFSVDTSGHEHKGEGPGGGQFTGSGEAGKVLGLVKAIHNESTKSLDAKKYHETLAELGKLEAPDLHAVAMHFLPNNSEDSKTFWTKEIKRLSRKKIIEAIGYKIAATYRAHEANKLSAWEESKHPRGQPENDGEFGSGHGGASPPESKTREEPKHPQAQPARQSTDDDQQPQEKNEPITPPPPGGYKPDPTRDANGDGVADAARVGVPAMEVPPPPPVPRLPNLTPHERTVEHHFARAYENNPDKIAEDFLALVRKGTKPGESPTFGTDDAKALTDVWSVQDQAARAQNRATLNTPLHQTANAIAKKAFLKHLDTLKPGDEVLVTNGGCGAGKGFALKNVPKALEIKGRCKAVWDSAGDQNSSENPWIQQEAEKRGLKCNYVYVHADPKTQWAHPERGVVKRAADPSDGRMVGASVFADSYAIGAKNMQAFYERHKASPHASFTFLENSGKPRELPGIPPEALQLDANELAQFAMDTVAKSDAPAHVKRGALMDQRIWGGANAAAA